MQDHKFSLELDESLEFLKKHFDIKRKILVQKVWWGQKFVWGPLNCKMYSMSLYASYVWS